MKPKIRKLILTVQLLLILLLPVYVSLRTEEGNDFRLTIISGTVSQGRGIAVGYQTYGQARIPYVSIFTNTGDIIVSGLYHIGYQAILLSTTITDDQGFILTGYAFNPVRFLDVLVIKLNPDGTIEWATVFGSDRIDIGVKTIQYEDKYYVVGYTYASSRLRDSDILLAVLNNKGEPIIVKSLGVYGYDDIANDLIISKEGNILVTGETWSYNVSVSDVFVISLDTELNKNWAYTYGGAGVDKPQSIHYINNRILISGVTRSFNFGGTDGFLLELNDKGDINRIIGVGWEGDDGLLSVDYHSGNYILLGYTNLRENYDTMLIRLGENMDKSTLYIVANKYRDSPLSLNVNEESCQVLIKTSVNNTEYISLIKIDFKTSKGKITNLYTSSIKPANISIMHIVNINKNIGVTDWIRRKYAPRIQTINIAYDHENVWLKAVGLKIEKSSLKFETYRKEFNLMKWLNDNLINIVTLTAIILPIATVIGMIIRLLVKKQELKGSSTI